MKFSSCTKRLGALILLWCTIPYSYALKQIDPQQMMENPALLLQAAEQRQDFLEKILTQAMKQLEDIDLIWQDLGLEIGSNAIPTENKDELMAGIMEIRTFINNIKGRAFAQIDEHSLYFLLTLNKFLLEHVQKTIKKGFTQLPPFDLSQTKMEPIDISPADLQHALLTNNQFMEHVKEQASQAGFTWYNKWYNKFDRTIVQPAQKHKVIKKAGFAALAGGVGLYLWYHSKSDNYYLRKLCGYPPHLLGSGSLNESFHSGFEDIRQIASPLINIGEINKLDSDTQRNIFNAINAGVTDSPTQTIMRHVGNQAGNDVYQAVDTLNDASKKLLADHITVNNPESGYFIKLNPTYYINLPDAAKDAINKLKEPFNTIGEANPKPLKWLGQVEHFFIKNNLGHMPLMQFAGPTLFFVCKNELTNLATAAQKKINKLVNKLKGGEYSMRGDGFARLETTITFDDLVGLDHAKSIAHTILKYIEDADRFARKNLVPEKGYLLYGKTRTGKSQFAKALCGEIKLLMERLGRDKDDFRFFEIKTSWIIENGINAIVTIFKQHAPCVLFIDEIDLLGLQRAGGNQQMLSDFLSTLSGVMDSDPKKQVIILAATNNPESIDESMRQRGRFGKAIYFDYPCFAYRKEYLMRRLDGLAINTNFFDIEKLALETDGCSYEDINAMIKGAFQKTKLLGIALNQEQLEISLDEEIRNILMTDDKNITDQEKEIIAAYQAGTALAHILLNSAHQIGKVTIRPIVPKLKEEYIWANPSKDKKQDPIEYGKVFVYRENDTLNLGTRNDKITECKILLAGAIAQRIVLNNQSSNYRVNDKKQAHAIARQLVFDGREIEHMPKELKNKLLGDACAMIELYEQELTQLLENHKELLTVLTKLLQEHLSLTGQQVKEIAAQFGIALPQPAQKDSREDEFASLLAQA